MMSYTLLGLTILLSWFPPSSSLAAQGNGMIRPPGKPTSGVVDKLVQFCNNNPGKCIRKRELKPLWPILDRIIKRNQHAEVKRTESDDVSINLLQDKLADFDRSVESRNQQRGEMQERSPEGDLSSRLTGITGGSSIKQITDSMDITSSDNADLESQSEDATTDNLNKAQKRETGEEKMMRTYFSEILKEIGW